MLLTFVGCVLPFLLLCQELALRRPLKCPPRTWRELYQFTRKRNAQEGGLDKRVPALFFAVMAWLLFAAWESAIWSLLGKGWPWWAVLPVALAAYAWLLWRRRQQLLRGEVQVRRTEFWLWLGVQGLCFYSLLSLLLLPWLLWRSRFLS